jgi:hypothetical protein
MFAVYGLIGLAMIIASYFLGIGFGHIPFLHMSFEIGYWLFFDSVAYHLSGTSLLHRIWKRKRLLFYLIFAGALLGAAFDFYGILITGMWEYPVVTDVPGIASLYVAWGITVLMYYSSYRVFSIIIKKEFGEFGKKLLSKPQEKTVFSWIGIAGSVLLIIPVIAYLFPGNYPNPALFASSLFGLWFLAEYVEYRRHERSLLKDILEGKWVPLAAVIAGSVICGLVWELLNVHTGSWLYKNIPFADFQILGIPIIIIIGWPALYVIFLSFYRAVFRGRDRIW